MTTVPRYAKGMGGLVPAEDFQIIDIWRSTTDGQLYAAVGFDDKRATVTRRFGCWGTVPEDSGRWRTVLPEYAAALQQAARRLT